MCLHCVYIPFMLIKYIIQILLCVIHIFVVIFYSIYFIYSFIFLCTCAMIFIYIPSTTPLDVKIYCLLYIYYSEDKIVLFDLKAYVWRPHECTGSPKSIRFRKEHQLCLEVGKNSKWSRNYFGPGTLYLGSSLIITTHWRRHYYLIYIYIRKLKLKKPGFLSQDHTASKWKNLDLNSNLSDS